MKIKKIFNKVYSSKLLKRIKSIIGEIMYYLSRKLKTGKNIIIATDYSELHTKKYKLAIIFFVVSMGILAGSIIYARCISKQMIFDDIKFDMTMEEVKSLQGENYILNVDIESGMVVILYDNVRIGKVNGRIYYYFAEDNTLCKALYSFEYSDEYQKKIKKFLKKKYGKSEECSEYDYYFDGTSLKCTMGISGVTYDGEVIWTEK